MIEYFNPREYDCWVTGEQNLPETVVERPKPIAIPKPMVAADNSWQAYIVEPPDTTPSMWAKVAKMAKAIRWDLENDRLCMDHALGHDVFPRFGDIYTPEDDRMILSGQKIGIVARIIGKSYNGVKGRRRRLLEKRRTRHAA